MSRVAAHDPAPDRRGRPPIAGLAVVLLAATGGTLLFLFSRADVHVAADGTLVEPFWMLGLGMLTLVAAAVTAVAAGVVWLVRSRRGVPGHGA